MNCYTDLATLRASAVLQGNAADALWLADAVAMSRGLDGELERHLYSEIATKYFDGAGGDSLLLDDDLLAVTSLAIDEDGDGVYELELVEDEDYWLLPSNTSPKWEVELTPFSDMGYWPYRRRAVRITGLWGYCNDVAATGDEVESDPLTASGTTIAVNSADNFSPGQTLVIGGEQMYLQAVTAGADEAPDTLTVLRGLNGTTAMEHAKDTPIQRRVFPDDLVKVVVMETVRIRRDTHTGHSGSVAATEFGGYSVFAATYPKIRDLMAPFRKVLA